MITISNFFEKINGHSKIKVFTWRNRVIKALCIRVIMRLGAMKSGSPFEKQLFDKPTMIENWNLTDSWDHYYWCCYKLSEKHKNKNIQDRIKEVESQINNAEELYKKANAVGILKEPDESLYSSWKEGIEELGNLMSE